MELTQLTKTQAVAFIETKAYEDLTYKQIADFQILQERVCVPFSVYHGAATEATGRCIMSDELYHPLGMKGIIIDLMKKAPISTFDEIMELIPAGKRIEIFQGD